MWRPVGMATSRAAPTASRTRSRRTAPHERAGPLREVDVARTTRAARETSGHGHDEPRPRARSRTATTPVPTACGRRPRPSRRRPSLRDVFRLSSHADPAFLAEMLYEAVNWRDDGAEERPPLDELLADPRSRRYVEDWGRIGRRRDRRARPPRRAGRRRVVPPVHRGRARLRLRRRRRPRAVDRGVSRSSAASGSAPCCWARS